MGYFGIPFRNGVPIGLGSVVSFGAQQFDPSELFVGGTAGAWYDPSDLTTLFTTSAGTTQCAMPGLGAPVPVGLMLDKSQGLVGLGTQLVVNGDFSTGNLTNWQSSNGGSFALSSNRLQVTGAGANTTGAAYTLNTTVGAAYAVSFVVTLGTATIVDSQMSPSVAGGAGIANSYQYITSNQTITYYFVATAATTYFQFLPRGTGLTAFIDDFSVKTLGPGNHAIAFNDSTKRPVLMARVNLLTYSEEFDSGAWVKTNATAANTSATTDPLGGTTAEIITALAGTAGKFVRQNLTVPSNVTFSVYAKADTQRYIQLVSDGDTEAYANFDLQAGAGQTGTKGTKTTSSITDVGNGWYRCVATFTGATAGVSARVFFVDNASALWFANSTTTGAYYLWGADLRPANIGANVPAYQRIADANTYDTSGFPLYLFFDGIDDSMYTPASIPFATVTSDGQARRNLLSFPTVFNDPFWTVSGTTVSANSTTAPDGTTTADTLTETAAAGSHQIYNTSQLLGVPTPLCMSVYVKPNGRTWVFLGDDGGGVFFNLVGAGSVGTQQAGRTGAISSVGDGWYRVVVTGNRPAVNDSVYIALCSADNTLSYTGNGTSGVFIWGAQFESGSTATAFQNIGTDKVAVFAGVRKLSDANIGVPAELSSNASTNNGSFVLYSAVSSAANYGFGLRSTVWGFGTATTFAAPITNVIDGLFDIAGANDSDEVKSRIDGQGQTLSFSGSFGGTGNFGTYPLYIGARNNASIWFNGHLHSLIIAGSAVSAGNISATEQWVANKTGIVIP